MYKKPPFAILLELYINAGTITYVSLSHKTNIICNGSSILRHCALHRKYSLCVLACSKSVCNSQKGGTGGAGSNNCHQPWEKDARFNTNGLYILTEPNLRALLNELHPVRGNWYNIGLELDIPHTTLDCFKQIYSDPSDLLREVLKHWLDTTTDPPPTWKAVITALRSPIVDKKRVAEQLGSKYCTQIPSSRNESNSLTALENHEGISILPHIATS